MQRIRSATTRAAMAALFLCAVSEQAPADAAPAPQPVRIEFFPPAIRLDAAARQASVVVTGYDAAGQPVDLSATAELSPADAAIARASGRTLSAAANGKTEVVVRAVGLEADAKLAVEVVGQEQPARVSFEYHTLAVLSKLGCNSGACHGSPSGKSGFRLSLRAYDSVFDAQTLTRESFGRRTNLLQPDQSLILKKSLMEISHGGGRKLKKSDAAYAILRDWIAQGCQVDPTGAPRCDRIEVTPGKRVLHAPARSQQLAVWAHFTDGSQRVVTGLVMFSSSDEAVAKVDAAGLVTSGGRGETAILVRYLEQTQTAYLTFLEDVPGFVWNDPPEHNYVDRFVFAKLKQLQILPSDVCADDEFVRRVYLDAIGALPTIAEAEAFLADGAADKRAKLVDALVERPEMAEFWALKWGDLLRLRNAKMTPAGVHKFHRWLVAAFRDNLPYDRFLRELLASGGSTFANPAANYYRAAAETTDCTETTSQLFLGIRIQCAKCHNHPFERWTQDNYYGISAFFNRVQRKPGPSPDEQVVWVARAGEVTQPRTGKTMPPWLPLTGSIESPGPSDRRQQLVDWMVRPDNPFVAKAEVNRLWGHVMGRGIVEPVDDFRDSNPPSSAELLAALAEDFVQHGFDRKHVLRTILKSRTYQLSSRRNEFNQLDTRYFSHAQVRMLSAEQLLDAVCRVSGVAEKFGGLPAGTRATQLPSPDVDVEFLKVFGQPARETACQCERSGDANLSQALQMINGSLVHGKVRAEGNRFRQAVAAGKSDADAVGELYLAALCRRPGPEELATATGHVANAGDRLRGLEDVCWAILNSNEFLFQH